MINKNEQLNNEKRTLFTSRDCAYSAVFVALTISAQLALSAIPGIEIVTLLFVTYSFAFGIIRGMVCAVAFSLIRMLVFGFYPTVLVLYLVYYTALSALFGFLGRRIKNPIKHLWLIVLVACVCTVSFTLLDCAINSLWYGYTKRMMEVYFNASLAFMIPQLICTAISTSILFLPINKALSIFAKKH